MRFAIIGAGMQGRACAYDLARSKGVEDLLIIDQEEDRARSSVRAAASAEGGATCRHLRLDVSSSKAVAGAIEGADVVISAAPYFLNPGIAAAALRAGVNMVDMGGNTDVVRQELALDTEARQRGVTIIPDCGLAPGLCNVLVAHGVAALDSATDVTIRVGGLPQSPRPPLNYELVFSPYGLMNEYCGEAAVIRDGRLARIETLTEVEEIDLPAPLGKCEAFITSGGSSTLPWSFEGRLRSLDYKTVRYPGHCAMMRLLRGLGFFDDEPITVKGAQVKPRDVTAALMESRLDFPEDQDLVVLRVIVSGTSDGKRAIRRYDLLDFPDQVHGMTAMMRTTAYPTSVIAQMIARGETAGPGAIPVENAVPPGPLLSELEARGIKVTQSRPAD